MAMALECTKTKLAPVQVTVWGSPTDKDLMKWYHDFKNRKYRKTPAAVVRKRTPGAYLVSVWRIGEQSIYLDKFRSSYEIVEECNGFSKLAGMSE